MGSEMCIRDRPDGVLETSETVREGKVSGEESIEASNIGFRRFQKVPSAEGEEFSTVRTPTALFNGRSCGTHRSLAITCIGHLGGWTRGALRPYEDGILTTSFALAGRLGLTWYQDWDLREALNRSTDRHRTQDCARVSQHAFLEVKVAVLGDRPYIMLRCIRATR